MLRQDLEQISKRERVPALAAAAHVDGELREIAAVGSRKVGGKELVTENDQWHIGSCTKPMTSTLAGILIDAGRIDWHTTIGDVFDSWDDIDPDWQRVTLEQLLTHHSGAPNAVPAEIWQKAWNNIEETPTEQRIALVRGVLALAPDAVPGSTYIYSNAGYATAGLMMETCTKQDWESLITEHVFRPLDMLSTGFGAPGQPKMNDQPQGHSRTGRKLTPVEPGPGADNPAAIAPAGTVHCSIGDLLKFAASHANGCSLVSRDVLQRLHRRYAASGYAAGWQVQHRDWAKGYTVSHDGSNTYWLTSIWVAPFRRAAFVSSCNAPPPGGQQACYEAINGMISRLL
ncbi:MAG TPA: serine hydrolase domain-containing protein [Trichormus sp.]|jgi:CubicO group peptidase (beta-lactamase class C family)